MVRYDDFGDYHGYNEYDYEYQEYGWKTGYHKIMLDYEYDECIYRMLVNDNHDYGHLSVTHYENDDDDEDYDAGGDDDDNVQPPQC